jgi:hypothetical protein
MLKSAASASLGIVAGMVDTATVSGPAQLLTAAGKDLIDGVKHILSDTTEKHEVIFDPSGLEFNVHPDQVVGPGSFLLLHRGAMLQEAKLAVRLEGRLLLPFYDGSLLLDGAWLLLRLRRGDEYSGVREWFEATRAWRGAVSALVADATSGVLERDASLARLRPGTDGATTLFDEYARLRTLIYNDGVLTEREAGLRIGELTTTLSAARNAISSSDPAAFNVILTSLRSALAEGRTLPSPLGKTFTDEVLSLVDYRRPSIAAVADPKRTLQPVESDVLESMRYLPRALAEIGSR